MKRATVLVTLIGVVAVPLMQLPAVGQEIHIAEGDIRTSNPVAGSTEQEFSNSCDHPPTSQGVDGWVFELPASFGSTAVPVSLEGSRALGGAYDLDAYFYTSGCDFIRDFSLATKQDDEVGSIPPNTRFVVANLVFGANTHVMLCVGLAACPAVSGSPTISPSPTDSTSSTTSPSSSESPTDEGPRESITTMTSDRSEVAYLGRFTLSGQVSSEHPECGANEEIGVRIDQRIFGESDFEHVADAVVSDDGTWSVLLRAAHNASYVAEPQSTDDCTGIVSSPIDVLVRAEIAIDGRARCNKNGVKGRVTPVAAGTQVLLQRKNRRWSTVDKDALDQRSRFGLSPSKCRGAYRVLWPPQDVRNVEGATSFRMSSRRSSRR